MEIKLPKNVKKIINLLEKAGHQTYIVGGCVRDSILGVEPHDWDICTSALPDEIISVFNKSYVVLTDAIQYGTISVIVNRVMYEITTFRKDGNYSDGRRPDSVEFTKSIHDDLARRDLTINAMAYSPNTGIIDDYNGIEDIHNKIIKCVGSPVGRIKEDGLRILRALRFAARFGFHIESNTSKAMLDNLNLLEKISKERIGKEFIAFMNSTPSNITAALYDKEYILAKIIPDIEDMFGLEQNNPYHVYNVWGHTLVALNSYKGNDLIVKLAILFHDIGKPGCKTTDKNGIGHFHGHSSISAIITSNALKELKIPNNIIEPVVELVKYHDSLFETSPKSIKHWLNKIGETQFNRLIEVRYADIKGQNPNMINERVEKVDNVKKILEEVIRTNACFSIKDLAINGCDLLDSGIPEGKDIGIILNELLNMVMSEDIANEKDGLLIQAKEIFEKI